MDGSVRPLTRRAFVRGAVFASVAAAGVAVRPIRETLAAGATVEGEVPRLAVHDPVTGVAARAGQLLAVGGHAGSPRAWTLPPGGAAWSDAAADDAFPEATSLQDVTAHPTGFLAAGWRETPVGPRPSLFSSDDGASWSTASLPEVGHGVCLGIASNEGAVVAVGTTFAEADVREPARTIAFVSDIGGAWSEVPLDGVKHPQHGSTTMVAATRAAFLIATVDVTGSALYASATPNGPWRRVNAPRTDETVSFLAAADTDAGVLLAGIDVLDRPRFWLEGVRGWRETAAPGDVDRAAHVIGLTLAGETLVAAGSDPSGSFVEEVTA